MFAINRQGASEQLIVVPAQFRGTQALGQERLFEQLDIVVSYSDSPDRTPPVIWNVGFAPDTGSLSIAASDASGVEHVWVTYSTNGDLWQSVELAYSADTDLWEGALPEGPERAVFVVQAMDGAGNVSHSSNKGQFFGATEGDMVYLPLALNAARP
jgi:hypothetical protein